MVPRQMRGKIKCSSSAPCFETGNVSEMSAALRWTPQMMILHKLDWTEDKIANFDAWEYLSFTASELNKDRAMINHDNRLLAY